MKVLDKAVEMVAYFYMEDKKQMVKPIRFRIMNENEEYKVYKIDKIRAYHEEKMEGRNYLTYTCDVIDNGIKKICEIRFYKSTMKWVLFKI